MLNYITHNTWTKNIGTDFSSFVHKIILKKYDKFIILNQFEWEWHVYQRFTPARLHQLIKYCKNNSIFLDIITGSSEKNYPIDKVNQNFREIAKVEYWDTFWLGRTYHVLEYNARQYPQQIKVIDLQKHLDYKFHFICMNGKSRPHRAELLDLLAKFNLINKNAISAISFEFKYYNYKYLQNFKPMLLNDEFKNIELSGPVIWHMWHNIPTEYYQSFAQLVSETSVEAIILSEKTAVPLILGKPFLVAGQAYFHEFLKNLGFQLYDEIFDYSFDKELNYEKRFKMLLENFVNLQKIPLSDLHKLQLKIAEKVEFNKIRAREIISDNSRYPKIVKDMLEYYNETGVALDKQTIDDRIALRTSLQSKF